MHLDYETHSDPEILGALHQARVVPRRKEIALQRYPANHSRWDSQQRSSFRVWCGDQPAIHLVVGPALAGLQRKTAAFCRHNPDLACRPLFFFQRGGLDFLGQESAGLFNLEEALAGRRVDAAGWREAVAETARRLASTRRPSTPARLMKEMQAFEESVLAIAAFTRIDRVFLTETIFPLLRLEAGRAPVATAWTNGDFIAKNILLDAGGRPRLVDYEFAQRTHFAAGDWFRLRHFSSVPDAAPVADLDGQTELPPWLEIRGWLEHVVKMHAVCPPAMALADLAKISGRITQLAETATRSSLGSVFFSPAPAGASATPAATAAAADELVVEWSRAGTSGAPLTRSLSLVPHKWSELHADLAPSPGGTLQLRLRLPARPGLLELRSVELHGADRGKVLWTVAPAQLGEVVTCSGNLLENSTPEGLGLIHFGGESAVHLPLIRLPRSETGLGLACWVRYVPTLLDFSRRLRQAQADGQLPALLSDPGTPGLIEGQRAAPEVTAQLFVPEGDAYREEKSFRTELREFQAWTDLVYDLPPLPAGAVLRFDPADQPGLIELSHLAVEPRDAGPGAGGTVPLAELRAEEHAVLTLQEDAAAILSFGHDPILKLPPLDPGLAGRPCRLRLTLRYLPTVPAATWAAALRAHSQELISLQVRLHDAGGQIRNREAKLADQAERAAAALAAAHAGEDALRQNLAQLNAELVAAQQEAGRLQERLRQEAYERIEVLEGLAAAKSAASKHVEAQAAVIARLESAHQEGTEALQALQAKHESLIESLYAQNEQCLAHEHNAGLLAAERDDTAARLNAARERLRELGELLQSLHRRPLLRLDRHAARLLAAAGRKAAETT